MPDDTPRNTAEKAGEAAPRASTASVHAARKGMDAAASTAERMGQAATDTANEFTRMFAEMKFPAVPDMQDMLAAQRRNMEALSTANRVALEGAQSVARRHMEIMQQAMAELSETMQSFASTEGPTARAAKQAELLKRGYERAVANMQELSELIQRSNAEAIGVLHRRFSEAMDEVRALMEKPGKAG